MKEPIIKRSFGRQRSIWVDTIKPTVRQIECEDRNWVEVAQNFVR
jgi:hypothetical protein